jgi:hypothetical protein
VAAYCRPRGVVERRTLNPAVVGHEPERLNQVYRHTETRGDAQKRARVLRNVGLEQRKTQSRVRYARNTGWRHRTNVLPSRFAANLCGSLSHSSADSSV